MSISSSDKPTVQTPELASKHDRYDERAEPEGNHVLAANA
jgi:hypothetical protein